MGISTMIMYSFLKQTHLWSPSPQGYQICSQYGVDLYLTKNINNNLTPYLTMIYIILTNLTTLRHQK